MAGRSADTYVSAFALHVPVALQAVWATEFLVFLDRRRSDESCGGESQAREEESELHLWDVERSGRRELVTWRSRRDQEVGRRWVVGGRKRPRRRLLASVRAWLL